MNPLIQQEFSSTQQQHGGTADQINQFKMVMKMYNVLTETCYTNCVSTHAQRKLTEEEKRCTALCLDKLINVRNRTILRWMELGPMVEKNIMMGIAMGNVDLPEKFL
ncbi:Mitochondrial import inner membrane translocase subunit Tim10 B [Oopsacas minuta]|uniref:Mitochondrial import inner membrane translocase subunit n=1 Tax=Oopsacas minuta TaxID=111878 RepID=A0AAV7JUV3_9METZ|nr:Mitochondrial import inner membrane translocase subunit Tim10 B [Oopsacas minuta]